MGQEWSEVVSEKSMTLQGRLQYYFLPQKLKVILSLFELDTNASKASLFSLQKKNFKYIFSGSYISCSEVVRYETILMIEKKDKSQRVCTIDLIVKCLFHVFSVHMC